MIFQNLLILSVTLISIGLLSIFEPVKSWKKAFTQRPMAGMLYGLCFLAPFLGNMAGGDIQTYVPDTLRYFRMLVLILLFAIAAAKILSKPSTAIHAGFPIWLMVYYALLAMASASYSQASLLSLWKGFEVLALVLVAISLSDQLKGWDDLRWLLNLLCFFLFFLILSVLAGLIVAPQDSFSRLSGTTWAAFQVSGVFPLINPNSVTQLGAFMVALETIRLLNWGKYNEDTRKNIFPVIISLTVVLLGHSRTSLFSLFLCICLVFFLLRRSWFLLTIPFITLIFALTKAYDYLAVFVLRGQNEQLFISMSGRTHFWEGVWDYFLKSPFLGHGYYSAHRVHFGTAGVDNTYLSVLICLGIVGFFIFILPIICTAFTLFRYAAIEYLVEPRKQEIWLQLTCIFFILIVRSLTGPSFDGLHHNLVIYAMLLTATSHFKRLRKAKLG